ncbi:metal-dependent transcriptional regulator [Flavobacteriaceae bacterium S0825]|uniref:metal-dependent transcriptional regulator n=1 Tax=Gaetbulibacter sp. S0825 TaxID=2720084 RepID=UPI00143196C3|nr:metal-dependent transcriptional regulator [Gaetbulibacter sp. S0825]MCK0108368.1 metal-dependent transcriptional regulator [Flavobacteriaceae bacterium S0825]NIX64004.1 metal-dependent transcriptional regulator [Gaetbulibacter sp. S0825]
MNDYNPISALIIFFGITILLFLLFRPTKGWFWLLKRNFKSDEKVIIEDILKQLYHFENSGNKVDTKTLVQSLNFKNKSIVEAIKKMSINDLVYFDKDALKLTEEGQEYALRIIRVHRLWERYLADRTGFHKNEWHDRAERMEHKLNRDETNKLASQLGNPKFDPHGDPIPTKTGKIAEIEGVELPLLPVNSIARITHIEDEPEVIYKQILAENIHIGSLLKVVENNNTRIVFHSEGEEVVLAPIVASNLTVLPIEKEVVIEDNIARLSGLQEDEEAEIIGISKESRGESRRRLLDLGFVKGSKIKIDLLNPLGEPHAYLVKGTSIALRKDQASKILIKKLDNGY